MRAPLISEWMSDGAVHQLRWMDRSLVEPTVPFPKLRLGFLSDNGVVGLWRLDSFLILLHT